MSAHVHDYDWIEEQRTYSDGSYSRSLEWVRNCKVCHFSPDRTAWRVLVTGARNHTNRFLIWNALSDELAHAESVGLPMVVVEGQCPHGGADKIAEQWYFAARKTRRNVWHDPFLANWSALGKRAGPYRNQQMVDAGANVCLAFPLPTSRGTFDCIRRAKDAGIPVKEFDSAASPHREDTTT